jgi:hypothetical protein
MLQRSDDAEYRASVLLRTRPILTIPSLFGMIKFARKSGVKTPPVECVSRRFPLQMNKTPYSR